MKHLYIKYYPKIQYTTTVKKIYNMVLIQVIKEVYQLHIKQCFTDMIFKYTIQMQIHLIKLTLLHIKMLTHETTMLP